MLILGASTRAAAWSALRSGLSPFAADLFADRDLAAVAPCLRISRENYPEGLYAAADSLPRAPWIYTGGLENHPGLIARLADSRPLWGNNAEVVRVARDPCFVADTLRAARLPAPEVQIDPAGLPRDGSWLRKPRGSAGGCGIEPWGVDVLGPSSLPFRSSYYQKHVPGLTLSAVFVGTRTGAVLAGITRQFTGRRGAPFAYRGSIAPWPVTADSAGQIADIGKTLATGCGLVGLFGVDLVLAADGMPTPVEINPRYTASVEVIELALGRSLLAAHHCACERITFDVPWPSSPARVVAKEILYAETDVIFEWDGDVPVWDARDPFRLTSVADVPPYLTSFEEGEPVLTYFGEGETPDAALANLERERQAWRGRLWPNQMTFQPS